MYTRNRNPSGPVLHLGHYAQPSYSRNYSHPPAHGYHYSYPTPPAAAPPPVYQVDPATFRRDFTNRLAELTVNSRPIIQNLSMLAQEYSRFAEIVTQSLEAHIRRVPPWMKLPAFYLMDAISKNVYDPYARHFASVVIPLFLESYHQVDAATRSKMEEMLLTWRTGSPTGKELFGVAPQIGIERGVWGDGSSSSSSGFYSGSGQITKAQVLSELEFTLGQKERNLQSNPYDSASRNHINVLHQLRKLVEVGVSQDELHQILAQLRSLMKNAAPALNPVPPPPAPRPQPQWQPQHHYPVSNQAPVLAPATSYGPPAPTYPQSGIVKVEPTVARLPMPSAPEAASPVPNVGSIQNLLSTLVKAGVVRNGTPVTSGSTQAEAPSSSEPIDLEKESMRSYRKNILAQNVQLTNADLTRKRLDIVSLLYNRLPSQCKQCGIRFADSALGKKAMEGHLDMHFRQNRKASQGVGRGHSRSWFIGIEDWVNDFSRDVKGKGRADDGSRPLHPRAAAAADLAKRDAELRAQFVVVPQGDEAKSISCPICKEALKSEFLEEDEDWVWKNAVMKDDRVYHATCYAEALSSTNTLAARLRSDLSSRSRSATPEVMRATPPKSSANTSLKGEPDGTPPFKKLALSTPA
ncbi:CID domain-containing protein [Pleurotus pulmonarius]